MVGALSSSGKKKLPKANILNAPTRFRRDRAGGRSFIFERSHPVIGRRTELANSRSRRGGIRCGRDLTWPVESLFSGCRSRAIAASVRSLAAAADVESSPSLGRPRRDWGTQVRRSIASGFDVMLLRGDDDDRRSLLPWFVAEREPELVVVSWWGSPPFREAAIAAAAAGTRVILAMDTQYAGPSHALVRRALLQGLYRRFWSFLVGAFVPGVRGAWFAEALGLPAKGGELGVLAFDAELFCPVDRRDGAEPSRRGRRFLYVGQYAKVKGLDLFLDAYAATTRDPWPLTCMGRGPLEAGVEAARPSAVTNPGSWLPRSNPGSFASIRYWCSPAGPKRGTSCSLRQRRSALRSCAPTAATPQRTLSTTSRVAS